MFHLYRVMDKDIGTGSRMRVLLLVSVSVGWWTSSDLWVTILIVEVYIMNTPETSAVIQGRYHATTIETTWMEKVCGYLINLVICFNLPEKVGLWSCKVMDELGLSSTRKFSFLQWIKWLLTLKYNFNFLCKRSWCLLSGISTTQTKKKCDYLSSHYYVEVGVWQD